MDDHTNRAVAIVGIGAVMPDAPDAATFWNNIKSGHYAISEVSPDRWDPALYYDPDPTVPDKTYSKIGGWVRDFTWEPMRWKLPIPPKVSEQMDVGQQWSIACSRAALLDAGWPDWPVDPERVAVIFGNAIGGEKHYQTTMRVMFPEFARELGNAPSFASLPESIRESVIAEAHKAYTSLSPEITEDTMPGELSNVLAGRVCNLFNFRGPNFTTDAACASGLAAMNAAVGGLLDHQYDVALSGGIDRNNAVNGFVKFCKIGALSATGTRPFDAGADGFVMGEGAAIYVLKRLADAERDGDRIYALLLALGGSSDGKGKGITAPNPVGQRLAVERAWRGSGLNPAAAGMMEAHGTSTRVGDLHESEALQSVFGPAGAAPGSIPLGSVKSNIGHLKAAAGVAGLFKATMSLHEKVLPPSLNFRTPNPNIDWASSPFAVNTELRGFPAGASGARSAGVSAFGFGGTNFHAVLEEYVPGRHRTDERRSYAGVDVPQASTAAAPAAGAPAARAAAGTVAGTVASVPAAPVASSSKAPLRGALVVGAASDSDLARRLADVVESAASVAAKPPAAPAAADLRAPVRVAIDYGDAAELADRAGRALKAVQSGQPAAWKMLRSRGVFFGRGPAPKTAFLYTGQGSQYVNMLKALCAVEPIVADTFAEADRVMTPLLGRPLTDYIFIDAQDPAAVAQLEEQLLQTEITQPAVLATDAALTRLLDAYGIGPDMVMGHSLGEYGALVAAQSLTFPAALEAVSARGREMASLSMGDNGAMAAVLAPLPEIERIVEAADGYVVIANVNSNGQAVIGGATPAVEKVVAELKAAGQTAIRLPVSHAFHTSIVAPASEPLKVVLRRLNVAPPRLPLVANVNGEFYPTAPGSEDEILDILGRQVASPVQFVKGLNTLYDAGARMFVELGPKKALHGFAEDVIVSAHDDAVALFTNHPKSGDVVAFNQALCGLYAAGLGTPAEPPAAVTPAAVTPAAVTPAAVTPAAVTPAAVERGIAAQAGGAPGGHIEDPAAYRPVVITGAALGLPGTEHVFDDSNVGRLLAGEQFIGPIPTRFRRRMLDKHITRLVKDEDGSGSFVTIGDTADVIKLAGRMGALDLVREFGVDEERDAALDSVTRLAVGAGLDSLRDAGIPLVQHYKTTSIGTQLPDRWMLPDSMRDDTGIVFASAFPGTSSFSDELDRYYVDRARRQTLDLLLALRARVRDDDPVTREIDERIRAVRQELEAEPYTFNRRFLFRALSMGHSQFAEIIGARGPNTQINSACSSTTQGIALAEDWIRAGRCRRVLVVAGDNVTGDSLIEWVGSGFLASGAAATDEAVEDAALPFDNRRHGMIMGMGAAGIVVESAEAARERGVQPICEVLGTVTANSAFHGSRLDVHHIAGVMEGVVRQAESRGHGRHDMASDMVFISHETYTPARGGSASAEINALRAVFRGDADEVVIANTKGFTGHSMGVGIEDVLAIKALETGLVPPIPNFREVDPELGNLNLSHGGSYPVHYALRLAAGFGSQITMSLLHWTPMPGGARRSPAQLGFAYRVIDPQAWQNWLASISGVDNPQLEVVQRRLRIADPGRGTRRAAPQPVAAQAPSPTRIVDVPRPATAPEARPRPVPSVARVPAAPVLAPAAAASAPAPAVPAPAVPAPAAVPAAAAFVPAQAPPPAAPVSDPVTAKVLEVVADKTGYPSDMLDLELDLEADLGIDTVKQAEVFASIRETFDIPRDDTIKLRDYPTLNHVIGFVRDRANLPAPVQAAPAVPAPAAVPAAAAFVPAQAPPPAAPVSDPVTAKVLEVVADKTGYPSDMLDLELDLEADLGIDTVKQAEVFASIRETFDIPRDDTIKLRDYPTLNHVIGFVRDRASGLGDAGAGAAAPAPDSSAATSGETAPDGTHVAADVTPASSAAGFPAPPAGSIEAANMVPRRVPVPVLRPPLQLCKPTGVDLGTGTRIVLAADRGGVGEALAKRLRKLKVEVLSLDPSAERSDVEGQLDGWLSTGAVQGVYWLPALDDEGPVADMDAGTWHDALQARVKNLATTMKRLYDNDPFLVVGTRLGGRHGYEPDGALCPLGGAVTGFTKAYKREKPEVLVKAVDFPASRKSAALADRLVEETLADPGCVEVGGDLAQRLTIGLEEQPAADGNPAFDLHGGSIYVVTGAAGSIVNAITADLATHGGGGIFHLLDLTPTPDEGDADLRRYVADRDGLKNELIARAKSAGQKVTPVAIEKDLARIERLAMAQSAIEAVRNAGGVAHYHSVNLTDPDAVAAVVAEIAGAHGRIDVLIHAAGLEISRRLGDKELREYDLVFDVKTDGWFNLMHAIGDLHVGATVAFSSVAGRFGNLGQTDYSAANDLLCKLTSNLRRSRPNTRGIVVDWTAWGGIGMATRGSIPTMMAAAGIDMLPPDAGIATVRRELTTGGTRGELVVAGALGVMTSEFDATGGLDADRVDLSSSGPMVGQVTGMGIYSGLTVETTLDPAAQPFLNDHRIDGTAVLPGVMGVEAFAEVACLLLPGWRVGAVENVDFREPVKFYRDEPRTLTINATLSPAGDAIVARCALIGIRTLANRPEPVATVHFTGNVRLVQAEPAAQRDAVERRDGRPAVNRDDIYAVYFHGPAYQVLDEAWRTGAGAAGRFAAGLPGNHEPAERSTVAEPRLIELCFQTAGIEEMGTTGKMGLPAHVDLIELPAHSPTDGQLTAEADPRGEGVFDARVVDDEGHVQVRLTGYRTITLPTSVNETLLGPIREAVAAGPAEG